LGTKGQHAHLQTTEAAFTGSYYCELLTKKTMSVNLKQLTNIRVYHQLKLPHSG